MALKSATRILFGENISDAIYDAVIVVSHSTRALSSYPGLQSLVPVLENYSKLNKSFEKGTVSLIQTEKVHSQRLIYSSTGSVNTDFDDVRKYIAAAQRAVSSAIGFGVKSPLLITIPYERFPQAELVSAIGALHPAYTSYSHRNEDGRSLKLDSLSLYPISDNSPRFLNIVNALQRAFIVSRDIGDGDPQRMAPPKVAEYVKSLFEGTSVKITIDDDQEKIKQEYPLLAAVNRSANDVENHQARVIWLEYNNEEPPSKNSGKEFETLMLVGKGVTIDTGGVDLKIGGSMFGMCRDKYGSAVVAGFFEALNILQPKGIKVRAAMCMVRNSIGSNAFTCDEIIISRSKKRIQITNTDAEGRIAMLDPLTKFTEEAHKEKNPHLYTLATLTGHEVLTYGYHAAIMDNGPAKQVLHAENLQQSSDIFGQPMEISRLHSEDYEFNNAENEYADIRQGNTKPSVQTLRGHMGPALFLIRASRLDEHGIDSKTPIKYTHVDIGSAMLEQPHISFPNPLLALVGHHIIPQNLKTRILQVFKVFDQNKDNTIDINDVGNLYRCLLININQEQLSEIESQLLKTEFDSVFLDNVVPRLLSQLQNEDSKFKPASDEILEAAFRTLIDHNKGEGLTKEKLENLMTSRGEFLSDSEMTEMKSHLSIRKNGILDWRSYVRDIKLSIQEMAQSQKGNNNRQAKN
ncbi:hypothetical protein FO519_002425 [Halicephalobus sp. NKZ332]|nr:hypothetical protein FO519_002425 [Halicephalobus sp. NKZ332]